MTEHDIAKALEVWTLQNLLNVSIMLGILAVGWLWSKATTSRWRSTFPCGCRSNSGGSSRCCWWTFCWSSW